MEQDLPGQAHDPLVVRGHHQPRVDQEPPPHPAADRAQAGRLPRRAEVDLGGIVQDQEPARPRPASVVSCQWGAAMASKVASGRSSRR